MKNGEKLASTILVPYLTGHGGMETVLLDVVNHFSNSESIDLRVYFSQCVGDDSFCEDFICKGQLINKPKAQKQTKISKIVNFFRLVYFLVFTNERQIICMSPILVRIAATVKRFFRKKYMVISWIHFSLVGGNLKAIRYLKMADRHLAISSGIKKQLREMDIPDDSIAVVYNPINTDVPLIPYDASHEKTSFLYVGRVQWRGQKNLHELFDALTELTGNWQLTVIGSGDNQVISTFVREHNLSDRVNLLGWQTEPWKQVTDIDCSVLTSKFEGLPMCIIESVIRGIPMVSNNCPTGPEDLIFPKVNGYIYQMGDSKALAEVLQRFIDGKESFNHACVAESLQWLSSENYYSRLTELLLDSKNNTFSRIATKGLN